MYEKRALRTLTPFDVARYSTDMGYANPWIHKKENKKC
jgi:hypothetical protein